MRFSRYINMRFVILLYFIFLNNTEKFHASVSYDDSSVSTANGFIPPNAVNSKVPLDRETQTSDDNNAALADEKAALKAGKNANNLQVVQNAPNPVEENIENKPINDDYSVEKNDEKQEVAKEGDEDKLNVRPLREISILPEPTDENIKIEDIATNSAANSPPEKNEKSDSGFLSSNVKKGLAVAGGVAGAGLLAAGGYYAVKNKEKIGDFFSNLMGKKSEDTEESTEGEESKNTEESKKGEESDKKDSDKKDSAKKEDTKEEGSGLGAKLSSIKETLTADNMRLTSILGLTGVATGIAGVGVLASGRNADGTISENAKTTGKMLLGATGVLAGTGALSYYMNNTKEVNATIGKGLGSIAKTGGKIIAGIPGAIVSGTKAVSETISNNKDASVIALAGIGTLGAGLFAKSYENKHGKDSETGVGKVINAVGGSAGIMGIAGITGLLGTAMYASKTDAISKVISNTVSDLSGNKEGKQELTKEEKSNLLGVGIAGLGTMAGIGALGYNLYTNREISQDTDNDLGEGFNSAKNIFTGKNSNSENDISDDSSGGIFGTIKNFFNKDKGSKNDKGNNVNETKQNLEEENAKESGDRVSGSNYGFVDREEKLVNINNIPSENFGSNTGFNQNNTSGQSIELKPGVNLDIDQIKQFAKSKNISEEEIRQELAKRPISEDEFKRMLSLSNLQLSEKEIDALVPRNELTPDEFSEALNSVGFKLSEEDFNLLTEHGTKNISTEKVREIIRANSPDISDAILNNVVPDRNQVITEEMAKKILMQQGVKENYADILIENRHDVPSEDVEKIVTSILLKKKSEGGGFSDNTSLENVNNKVSTPDKGFGDDNGFGVSDDKLNNNQNHTGFVTEEKLNDHNNNINNNIINNAFGENTGFSSGGNNFNVGGFGNFNTNNKSQINVKNAQNIAKGTIAAGGAAVVGGLGYNVLSSLAKKYSESTGEEKGVMDLIQGVLNGDENAKKALSGVNVKDIFSNTKGNIAAGVGATGAILGGLGLSVLPNDNNKNNSTNSGFSTGFAPSRGSLYTNVLTNEIDKAAGLAKGMAAVGGAAVVGGLGYNALNSLTKKYSENSGEEKGMVDLVKGVINGDEYAKEALSEFRVTDLFSGTSGNIAAGLGAAGAVLGGLGLTALPKKTEYGYIGKDGSILSSTGGGFLGGLGGMGSFGGGMFGGSPYGTTSTATKVGLGVAAVGGTVLAGSLIKNYFDDKKSDEKQAEANKAVMDDIESVRGHYKKADEELKEAKLKISDTYYNSLKEVISDYHKSQEEYDAAKSKREKLEKELERANARVESAPPELKEKEKEKLNAIKSELDKAIIEEGNLENALKGKSEKVDEITSIDTNKKNVEEARSKVEEIEKQISEISDKEKTLQDSEGDYNKAREELNALQKQYDEADDATKTVLQSQLEEAQKKVEETASKYEIAKKDYEYAVNTKEDKEKLLEEAKNSLKEAESELDKSQKLHDAVNNIIKAEESGNKKDILAAKNNLFDTIKNEEIDVNLPKEAQKELDQHEKNLDTAQKNFDSAKNTLLDNLESTERITKTKNALEEAKSALAEDPNNEKLKKEFEKARNEYEKEQNRILENIDNLNEAERKLEADPNNKKLQNELNAAQSKLNTVAKAQPVEEKKDRILGLSKTGLIAGAAAAIGVVGAFGSKMSLGARILGGSMFSGPMMGGSMMGGSIMGGFGGSYGMNQSPSLLSRLFGGGNTMNSMNSMNSMNPTTSQPGLLSRLFGGNKNANVNNTQNTVNSGFANPNNAANTMNNGFSTNSNFQNQPTETQDNKNASTNVPNKVESAPKKGFFEKLLSKKPSNDSSKAKDTGASSKSKKADSNDSLLQGQQAAPKAQFNSSIAQRLKGITNLGRDVKKKTSDTFIDAKEGARSALGVKYSGPKGVVRDYDSGDTDFPLLTPEIQQTKLANIRQSHAATNASDADSFLSNYDPNSVPINTSLFNLKPNPHNVPYQEKDRVGVQNDLSNAYNGLNEMKKNMLLAEKKRDMLQKNLANLDKDSDEYRSTQAKIADLDKFLIDSRGQYSQYEKQVNDFKTSVESNNKFKKPIELSSSLISEGGVNHYYDIVGYKGDVLKEMTSQSFNTLSKSNNNSHDAMLLTLDKYKDTLSYVKEGLDAKKDEKAKLEAELRTMSKDDPRYKEKLKLLDEMERGIYDAEREYFMARDNYDSMKLNVDPDEFKKDLIERSKELDANEDLLTRKGDGLKQDLDGKLNEQKEQKKLYDNKLKEQKENENNIKKLESSIGKSKLKRDITLQPSYRRAYDLITDYHSKDTHTPEEEKAYKDAVATFAPKYSEKDLKKLVDQEKNLKELQEKREPLAAEAENMRKEGLSLAEEVEGIKKEISNNDNELGKIKGEKEDIYKAHNEVIRKKAINDTLKYSEEDYPQHVADEKDRINKENNKLVDEIKEGEKNIEQLEHEKKKTEKSLQEAIKKGDKKAIEQNELALNKYEEDINNQKKEIANKQGKYNENVEYKNQIDNLTDKENYNKAKKEAEATSSDKPRKEGLSLVDEVANENSNKGSSSSKSDSNKSSNKNSTDSSYEPEENERRKESKSLVEQIKEEESSNKNQFGGSGDEERRPSSNLADDLDDIRASKPGDESSTGSKVGSLLDKAVSAAGSAASSAGNFVKDHKALTGGLALLLTSEIASGGALTGTLLKSLPSLLGAAGSGISSIFNGLGDAGKGLSDILSGDKSITDIFNSVEDIGSLSNLVSAGVNGAEGLAAGGAAEVAKMISGAQDGGSGLASVLNNLVSGGIFGNSDNVEKEKADKKKKVVDDVKQQLEKITKLEGINGRLKAAGEKFGIDLNKVINGMKDGTPISEDVLKKLEDPELQKYVSENIDNQYGIKLLDSMKNEHEKLIKLNDVLKATDYAHAVKGVIGNPDATAYITLKAQECGLGDKNIKSILEKISKGDNTPLTEEEIKSVTDILANDKFKEHMLEAKKTYGADLLSAFEGSLALNDKRTPEEKEIDKSKANISAAINTLFDDPKTEGKIDALHEELGIDVSKVLNDIKNGVPVDNATLKKIMDNEEVIKTSLGTDISSKIITSVGEYSKITDMSNKTSSVHKEELSDAVKNKNDLIKSISYLNVMGEKKGHKNTEEILTALMEGKGEQYKEQLNEMMKDSLFMQDIKNVKEKYGVDIGAEMQKHKNVPTATEKILEDKKASYDSVVEGLKTIKEAEPITPEQKAVLEEIVGPDGKEIDVNKILEDIKSGDVSSIVNNKSTIETIINSGALDSKGMESVKKQFEAAKNVADNSQNYVQHNYKDEKAASTIKEINDKIKEQCTTNGKLDETKFKEEKAKYKDVLDVLTKMSNGEKLTESDIEKSKSNAAKELQSLTGIGVADNIANYDNYYEANVDKSVKEILADVTKKEIASGANGIFDPTTSTGSVLADALKDSAPKMEDIIPSDVRKDIEQKLDQGTNAEKFSNNLNDLNNKYPDINVKDVLDRISNGQATPSEVKTILEDKNFGKEFKELLQNSGKGDLYEKLDKLSQGVQSKDFDKLDEKLKENEKKVKELKSKGIDLPDFLEKVQNGTMTPEEIKNVMDKNGKEINDFLQSSGLSGISESLGNFQGNSNLKDDIEKHVNRDLAIPEGLDNISEKHGVDVKEVLDDIKSGKNLPDEQINKIINNPEVMKELSNLKEKTGYDVIDVLNKYKDGKVTAQEDFKKRQEEYKEKVEAAKQEDFFGEKKASEILDDKNLSSLLEKIESPNGKNVKELLEKMKAGEELTREEVKSIMGDDLVKEQVKSLDKIYGTNILDIASNYVDNREKREKENTSRIAEANINKLLSGGVGGTVHPSMVEAELGMKKYGIPSLLEIVKDIKNNDGSKHIKEIGKILYEPEFEGAKKLLDDIKGKTGLDISSVLQSVYLENEKEEENKKEEMKKLYGDLEAQELSKELSSNRALSDALDNVKDGDYVKALVEKMTNGEHVSDDEINKIKSDPDLRENLVKIGNITNVPIISVLEGYNEKRDEKVKKNSRENSMNTIETLLKRDGGDMHPALAVSKLKFSELGIDDIEGVMKDIQNNTLSDENFEKIKSILGDEHSLKVLEDIKSTYDIDIKGVFQYVKMSGNDKSMLETDALEHLREDPAATKALQDLTENKSLNGSISGIGKVHDVDIKDLLLRMSSGEDVSKEEIDHVLKNEALSNEIRKLDKEHGSEIYSTIFKYESEKEKRILTYNDKNNKEKIKNLFAEKPDAISYADAILSKHGVKLTDILNGIQGDNPHLYKDDIDKLLNDEDVSKALKEAGEEFGISDSINEILTFGQEKIEKMDFVQEGTIGEHLEDPRAKLALEKIDNSTLKSSLSAYNKQYGVDVYELFQKMSKGEFVTEEEIKKVTENEGLYKKLNALSLSSGVDFNGIIESYSEDRKTRDYLKRKDDAEEELNRLIPDDGETHGAVVYANVLLEDHAINFEDMMRDIKNGDFAKHENDINRILENPELKAIIESTDAEHDVKFLDILNSAKETIEYNKKETNEESRKNKAALGLNFSEHNVIERDQINKKLESVPIGADGYTMKTLIDNISKGISPGATEHEKQLREHALNFIKDNGLMNEESELGKEFLGIIRGIDEEHGTKIEYALGEHIAGRVKEPDVMPTERKTLNLSHLEGVDDSKHSQVNSKLESIKVGSTNIAELMEGLSHGVGSQEYEDTIKFIKDNDLTNNPNVMESIREVDTEYGSSVENTLNIHGLIDHKAEENKEILNVSEGKTKEEKPGPFDNISKAVKDLISGLQDQINSLSQSLSETKEKLMHQEVLTKEVEKEEVSHIIGDPEFLEKYNKEKGEEFEHERGSSREVVHENAARHNSKSGNNGSRGEKARIATTAEAA